MPTTPTAQRLTVAVIGLGSIGGVVAGCLAEADRHDVVACVRQPIERLTLEGPRGAADLPLRAVSDPAQAGAADWVLVCTKTIKPNPLRRGSSGCAGRRPGSPCCKTALAMSLVSRRSPTAPR